MEWQDTLEEEEDLEVAKETSEVSDKTEETAEVTEKDAPVEPSEESPPDFEGVDSTEDIPKGKEKQYGF